MSIAVQIGIVVASILVLLGVVALVRSAARSMNLNAEVQRKLIHVATGIYAISLPWIFADAWPVYLVVGLAFLAMVFLRYAKAGGGLGETLHGVKRKSYGDFMLALAVGLCFFLSEGNPLIYALPIAVLTLSDAAAALAGTAFGSRWFQVESGQKSIEGSAVFFVVTLLIAITCLQVFADLQIANALALALMIAAFGTLVEAQSWRGFDNLFLPLALLVFLKEHGRNDLAELALLASLFIAAILGFRIVGPFLGLSRHASRVYVVAIFLILAATDPQNAVLPAFVLVAHAWANARNPSRDDFADLDIVAALAFFSFGWLVIGNATGWTAVAHYNLTAMGLAMGLSVIALKGRLSGILAVGALLFGLRSAVVTYNPAQLNWAEPLYWAGMVCLILSAGVTLLAPTHFARDRVMKLTLIALVVPIGLYLFAVVEKLGFTLSPGA